jgi:hypothetical protein
MVLFHTCTLANIFFVNASKISQDPQERGRQQEKGRLLVQDEEEL